MGKSDINIRLATKEDLSQIMDLVRELAEYENEPDAVTASLQDYEDSFSNGIFNVLVAESAKAIIGIALYYYSFSTWRGKAMYLEDFIVKKSWRRRGVGQLLFDRFLDEARSLGCKMVRWQVLYWNELALGFSVGTLVAVFPTPGFSIFIGLLVILLYL